MEFFKKRKQITSPIFWPWFDIVVLGMTFFSIFFRTVGPLFYLDIHLCSISVQIQFNFSSNFSSIFVQFQFNSCSISDQFMFNFRSISAQFCFNFRFIIGFWFYFNLCVSNIIVGDMNDPDFLDDVLFRDQWNRDFGLWITKVKMSVQQKASWVDFLLGSLE